MDGSIFGNSYGDIFRDFNGHVLLPFASPFNICSIINVELKAINMLFLYIYKKNFYNI